MAFRVTRPSRPAGFDSDEEEERPKDELLSGYGSKGSIRQGREKQEKARPLVIASQPNADWREIARQRRQKASIYLPENAKVDGRAATPVLGAEADQINANPIAGGLKVSKPVDAPSPSPALASALAKSSLDTPPASGTQTPNETEEQKALKELLSGADAADKKKELDAISVAPDSLRMRAPTEDDAFRMDVESRPDVSTAEDYERVPIDQFGAALLRGMGWKPNEAQEAFVPQRRPALLGIGAKESSLGQDDGKKGINGKTAYKKPAPTFKPLVRKESESSPRAILPPSRERSRSPVSREQSDDDRRRRRDREYDSDRDRRRTEDKSSSRRDRDRYSDDEDRRRRRDRDDRRERERYDSDDRRDRDRGSDRRDRERHDSRRDREREKDRDRDDRRR